MMYEVVTSLGIFFLFHITCDMWFRWLESNSFEFTTAMKINLFSILLSFYRDCCMMQVDWKLQKENNFSTMLGCTLLDNVLWQNEGLRVETYYGEVPWFIAEVVFLCPGSRE